MKKRIYSAMSIVVMLLVLFVNCYFVNNNSIDIFDTEVPLAGSEDVYGMLDFENWQKGDYNYQTGKYSSSATRLCLIKCPTVEAGQKYTVNVSEKNVHILIREMSDAGKVVVSRNLLDGNTFEISANTTSIKIAMYVTGTTEKMSYDKYKEMFENGLKAYLTTDSVISSNDDEQIEEEPIQDEPIDNNTTNDDTTNDDTTNDDTNFGMTSFANWRSGNYSVSGGKYTSNASRICLNDYVKVSAGQIYTATITNSNYHILIRALDDNNKLVTSYNLANGDKLTVPSSVTKLGISLYDTKSKTTSFDMYKALFETGFKAYLTAQNENNSEASDEEDDEIIVESEEEVPAYGSSDDKDVVYPDVKSEIIAMIRNGDGTTHDVSKYHMKWLDVNSVFNSVVENECLLEFECAYGIWISFEKDGDYAKGIKMNGIDDTYKDCLAKSKERIANVMAGIDDSMTDLDKALYCYDNIVINSKYSQANAKCYYGGNVLAYNTGACAGISSAYRLLLRAVGIKSSFVQSSSMQHGWAMVQIDGKWYHADPTWDNTRYRYSNVVSRHYFMRNDSEYSGGTCIKKHYNWKVDGGYTSTSTKYTDWMVHDITVPMTFENGYWKYTDSETGHLMKIKLDGIDIIDLSL